MDDRNITSARAPSGTCETPGTPFAKSVLDGVMRVMPWSVEY